MRKIAISALFMLLVVRLFPSNAQQTPSFTHYNFTPFYYNPAVAGLENTTRIDGIFRYQYAGYQATTDAGGSPLTQFISVSTPLLNNKSGVGITLLNDQTGGKRINRAVALAYAYHLPLATGKLSIGASAGLHALQLTGDTYRPRDPNDALLPTTTITKSALDIGLGANFSTATYGVGLGVKHLTEPSFQFTTSPSNPLARTYFLQAHALIGVSYAIDLIPTLLVKSDMKRIWPELGMLATYRNQYHVGVNYRSGEGISALAGLKLGKFQLSYAFDGVMTGVLAKAPTSHELLLTYRIPPFRAGKKSIIRTPRYRF